MTRSRRGDPLAAKRRAAMREGWELASAHPLLAPIASRCHLYEAGAEPRCGYAGITIAGTLHARADEKLDPGEWAFVFAHLLLHLGLEHFPIERDAQAWNAACDVVVHRVLRGMRLGTCPQSMQCDLDEYPGDERRLYERFELEGVPNALRGIGSGDPDVGDLLGVTTQSRYYSDAERWAKLFAQGLVEAVQAAVGRASGSTSEAAIFDRTPIGRARSWVLTNFPLLGALATAFRFVVDRDVCQRMNVGVAAVAESVAEVYLNPTAGLDEQEARFVIAHELLHVGLRHMTRRLGRDPYLWNVACDYVINQWLIEMGVGHPPALGMLHDEQLKGMSAESVYDRIVTDLRTLRRLSTFRGRGEGDMIEGVPHGRSGPAGDFSDLDTFYRESLSRGLLAHQEQSRGLLPAGFVEEVWAVARPPIPWDVELARLFDVWFAPLEARRTYARPSRRQSSTPDIPRPRTHTPEAMRNSRTFGVLLDTSGSMDRALLAVALGTVASYAMARDVPAVRFVQCDAAPHDEGYVEPEMLAGRVRVRGRGGTVLQPGVQLLADAEDFPADAPLLVVTDGACDPLKITRRHAFLMPASGRLPFAPLGPVFRMSL